MENQYDVVALGELLIDFTFSGNDSQGFPSMQAHPGGAPANLLAAVTCLGGKTALISSVGDDAFGSLLIHTAAQAGIDCAGISKTDQAFTTLAFVLLDQSGDRSFSFARKPGADTLLKWDAINAELIENTKIFHFGSLSLTHEPGRTVTIQAVEYAENRGKLISFDPNLRPALWDDPEKAKEAILWGMKHADIVKLSEEELSFLFGSISYEQGVDMLLEQFDVSLVMLTLGADGCIISNGSFMVKEPALSGVRPVDTTGAGDIFAGSALWRFLQTGKDIPSLNLKDHRSIARFASAAAGLSTEMPGGISSIPGLDKVISTIGKN